MPCGCRALDIHAGAQVTKYGGEFADKISHINAQQAEKEGESEVTKLQKEVRSSDSVLLLMRPTSALQRAHGMAGSGKPQTLGFKQVKVKHPSCYW